MILVGFSGGLGNQIYQFALLKKLQLKYPNTEIKMDLSFYKQNHIHNGFELDKIFGISKNGILSANNRELLEVKYEIPFNAMEKFPVRLVKPAAWVNARSRKIFEKMGQRNEIKEEIQRETGSFEKQNPEELIKQIDSINIKKHCYINGYWQNELYFKEVLPKVLEELKFPDFKDQLNKDLEEQIKKEQAVSVHIRRGDYVNSIYDILTLEYYKKSIQYIENRADISSYYIFTDDIEYAEKQFSFLDNKYIVRHNKGENSWCDIKLMSLCKYNILANSSFSNWAGYFNKNNDRLVIYPSKYTKTEINTEKTEKGWMKIEV